MKMTKKQLMKQEAEDLVSFLEKRNKETIRIVKRDWSKFIRHIRRRWSVSNNNLIDPDYIFGCGRDLE